jgi:small subunit ribosomal protein S21
MLKIKVKKGNINQALKNLKNKVFKTKMLNDIRERKEFVKKSVKRRSEIDKAKYIQNLNDED